MQKNSWLLVHNLKVTIAISLHSSHCVYDKSLCHVLSSDKKQRFFLYQLRRYVTSLRDKNNDSWHNKVWQPIIIRYKAKSNVKLVDLDVWYSENQLLHIKWYAWCKTYSWYIRQVFLCLVTNFSNLSSVLWWIRLWILFMVNARLEATR